MTAIKIFTPRTNPPRLAKCGLDQRRSARRAFTTTVAALTLALSGCAADPSPTASQAGTAAQTDTAEASRDALPYWAGQVTPTQDPDLESERRLLGLDAIYPNATPTFYRYPRVGTLGTKCLVLVGWSERYFELALDRVPNIDVVVFNRFGFTEDRGKVFFGGGDGPAANARRAIESRRSRCG